jgi:hypothetical protein
MLIFKLNLSKLMLLAAISCKNLQIFYFKNPECQN